ncbi:PREDICTED: 2-aminoethanethiol dioxygenase-like [Fragaria vesca subsp. vesca]|uniref:2-aminoethanethiol dioxygenase-like n=1 Tax=Fragaria vesca subsp. vesca TaxID=101020 RepID=UPI0002C35A18|nr:PREDICTED: 2-aminoethanethiol dioxygenase-like [Fragaria vesca subsp. vesca]
MGMEAAGSIEQARDHFHHHHHHHHVGYMKNRVISKKKYCSKNRKVKHSSSDSALQRLFVSCKDVFKGLGNGTLPLPHQVQELRSVLDKIRPQDVGLSNDLQFFKPNTRVKGTPRVTYTTIYKCSNFSLCCFFIPATGVIPLHNHPGMTVFSKLLLGKMHIKSYDLVDDPTKKNSDGSQLRLAKLKADSVFTAPCNTSVLYPTTGGNIHAFTAITPCAVLDVLGPPYSKQDGRDCSYYRDHPYAAYPNATVTQEEGHYYGWLEEIEVPPNSEMDGIEYLGPQIIDTI